ncbi:hypothetical protein B0H10DRAFT_2199108 [Mycena sp. CBHHK59/15]|nr:hypothetical protein B0H10DRAFT_2199108 [Mycena sp. CBHHK59/15]
MGTGPGPEAAKAASLRQQLIHKFHLALKEEQEQAAGTGLNRTVRWQNSAPGGRGGKRTGAQPETRLSGNSENAAATATALARTAAKKRKDVFTKAHVPNLPDIISGLVTIFRPIRIGDYGVIFTSRGLMVGHVFAMHSKGGGKYGKHEAVTDSSNISALSKISVQLFQNIHGPQFRSIPTSTAILQSKQFAHIVPINFLCLLSSVPKPVPTGIELAPEDSETFKKLSAGFSTFVDAMKLFRKRGKNAAVGAGGLDDDIVEEEDTKYEHKNGSGTIFERQNAISSPGDEKNGSSGGYFRFGQKLAHSLKIGSDKNEPIGHNRDVASKGIKRGPVGKLLWQPSNSCWRRPRAAIEGAGKRVIIEAHLIKGDEAAGFSHTGEHIKKILLEVIRQIGPERFCAIGSDSTGNTKWAREGAADEIKTLLIVPDPCHHLSNTIKDITRLSYFIDVISKMRETITYFSQSTHSATHLNALRVILSVNHGLEKIGKTRFGTLYWAGYALLPNLPLISDLISSSG